MKTKTTYFFTILYILSLFIFTHFIYLDASGYMVGKFFSDSDEDSILFGLLFLPIWFCCSFIISQRIHAYNHELIRYRSYEKWWISIQKQCISLILIAYIFLGILVRVIEGRKENGFWPLLINAVFIFEIMLLGGILSKQIQMISLLVAFVEAVSGKIRMIYRVSYYKNIFTWWDIPVNGYLRGIDIVILLIEIAVIIFGIYAMKINCFNNILRGREYGNY